MKVDVVFLPALLKPEHLRDRAVVVFDVLRATTTMIAALDAGVCEIRVFDSLDAAMRAANALGSPRVLCGEQKCLQPPGFDLGNSPSGFQERLHKGRVVFMATSNGTRAIVGARESKEMYVAALVNASAVARHLIARRFDEVTLLCAGTAGDVAAEDVLGAGAVLNALSAQSIPLLLNESADIALDLFRSRQTDLPRALRQTHGGRSVTAVGLERDIDDAAALDTSPIVGVVRDHVVRIFAAT